jgi:hypothetical protein
MEVRRGPAGSLGLGCCWGLGSMKGLCYGE